MCGHIIARGENKDQPCGRQLGHPGKHMAVLTVKNERVRHRERQREGGSQHAKNRVGMWKRQGIRFDGQPLTYDVWVQLKVFQGGGCGLCGRNEFWGSLHADHRHDLSGELRGALCLECNQRAVGFYEKYGHYRNETVEAAIRAYLADPPAEKFKRRRSPVVLSVNVEPVVFGPPVVQTTAIVPVEPATPSNSGRRYNTGNL